jgi:nucleoid-associated protein YgaU
MTRETKIGLLVGLAFIIVVGILLSDYLRSTGEPPQAVLSSAASDVREAVNSPGTNNPPITVVPPRDAAPQEQVPMRDELNPTPSPVIPTERSTQDQTPAPAQPDQGAVVNPPVQDNDALTRAAQQHGEQLVPVNPDGTATSTQQNSPGPTSSQARSYVAQSGDSVSRMASHYMVGGNTRSNRQAIINANPSLQYDPDRVIVGESYVIPGRTQSIAAVPAAPTDSTSDSNDTAAPTAGAVYTVQSGDSLWSIANDELGDPSAVDSIKELNLTTLKGKDHDVLYPGMKLRLPGKSNNG